MPITIDKVKKLETFVLEYCPDAKIIKKGKVLTMGYKELSFTTGCVVGSFLKAAMNLTPNIIIKPTRSQELEVTFF